jgi:hypothetical protein
MELRAYRTALEMVGYTVTASWLDACDTDECTAHEAQTDLDEVRLADALIFFAEDPKTAWPRGSRCVEYGIALQMGKPIYVIGPRENVFQLLLPDTAFFNSVDDLIRGIA